MSFILFEKWILISNDANKKIIFFSDDNWILTKAFDGFQSWNMTQDYLINHVLPWKINVQVAYTALCMVIQEYYSCLIQKTFYHKNDENHSNKNIRKRGFKILF